MSEKVSRGQRAIQQLNLRVNDQCLDDRSQLIQLLVQFLDYPDLVNAENHKTANMMGNFNLLKEQYRLAEEQQQNQNYEDKKQLCQCCGMIVHTQNIPYCTRLAQINVGLGSRLYFNSILYNVLIFSLAIALFSFYYIITNILACKAQNCGIDGIGLRYKIFSQNLHQNQLRTSSILGIVLVSIWGIIEVIKNHRQKKIAIQLSKKFIQASQFTIMLIDFPSSLLSSTDQQNLGVFQRIFKQYQKKMESKLQYDVVKTNIARNLYIQKQTNKQKTQQLKLRLKQKQQLIKQWVLQRQNHNRFTQSFEERQRVYDEYLDFYTNEFQVNQKYKGQQDQNVIVFVTFAESKVKEEIEFNARRPTPLNLFNLCHQNLFPIEGVKVFKAPIPEQIKWTNIGFPQKSKLQRIFLVYGVSIIFLAISLAITYGLNQIKGRQTWVSIIVSLTITGINFGLQFAIMFLSKFLNQMTETNVQFNIAFKICFFQILNVIGVPLAALYISDKSLYGVGGLSEDIFFIALFNILPPIGRFIDPFYLLITIRNKIYEMPEYRLKNFNCQRDFNRIYEDNDFDLGYEYAYVIKTSIFTSFFMCVQPIIAVFAVIGLILMFLVNKYRILYRFFKPRYYSSTVNTFVDYLLNVSPVTFGLGMLIFTNWQTDHSLGSTLMLNWAIFIIGLFFLFFPFRIFYKCIKQPQLPAISYQQKKSLFPAEYDRMNPLTQEAALSEHFDYLKSLSDKNQLTLQARVINESVIRRPIGLQNSNIRKSKIQMIQGFRSSIRNSRIFCQIKDSHVLHNSPKSAQNHTTLTGANVVSYNYIPPNYIGMQSRQNFKMYREKQLDHDDQ